MYKEELGLGPVPCDESCEQIGDNYDYQKAIAENKRYIEVIRQKCGTEPYGARLKVKRMDHEFGMYTEVVVEFQESVEEAVEYAYRCEGNMPQTWDDVTPIVPKEKVTHDEDND